MLKFVANVTYSNGATESAIIKAETRKQAWEKLLLAFDGGDGLADVSIRGPVLPKYEIK